MPAHVDPESTSSRLNQRIEPFHGEELTDMTSITATHPERIEAQATISSRGQIAIPAKILRAAGLKEGDLLRFTYEGGTLLLEPIALLSAEQLFGVLDRPEDNGHFALDIEAARNERSHAILTNRPNQAGGD